MSFYYIYERIKILLSACYCCQKLGIKKRGMRIFFAYKVLVYVGGKNEINQKNDISMYRRYNTLTYANFNNLYFY